ncbi:MAG: DUF1553 domain-containing protein, partial [Planctomycetaceae bacterium]|nr:DUF1553 domain-containing protein [Planctomycetaceae bacterium]
ENTNRDPDNVFLWKYSRRRLDAESIRDALLFVSGELDHEQGGPHPFIPWHKKGYSLNAPFHQDYPTNKRSVYLMTQRLYKHPFLGRFNGPETNETSGSRDSSHLPTQALYLMNAPLVPELAAAFGKRIQQSAESDEAQIIQAYQLAFCRNPTAEELSDAAQFLEYYREELNTEKSDQDRDTNQLAWTGLAKVLLTSNEFFFIY